MIQGSGLDSGREHVEISTNAFNGNDGPFPEIEIVNVHTVNIRSNAFYRKCFCVDRIMLQNNSILNELFSSIFDIRNRRI